MKMTLAEALFQCETARESCVQRGNAEWATIWAQRLKKLEEALPSGSGFDAGSRLVHVSKPPQGECLILSTSFHHMNEMGSYTHWTDYGITVRPSFYGRVQVDVAPNDDYVGDAFDSALREEREWLTL